MTCAAAASAQEVRGRIVAEESREPLLGVFVMLRDSTGARIAGALTDSAGRYRVRTNRAGTFTVAAERLGYQSTASTSFELQLTAIVNQDFTLSVKPVILPGVVATTRGCELSRGRAAQVNQIWEEARKGLNVTSWAMTEQMISYEFVRYSREVTGTNQIVRDYVEQRSNRVTGSPWRLASPEDLIEKGFLRNSSLQGFTDFYVPTAEVLISPLFLSTHCFDVIDQAANKRVGLRFRPIAPPDTGQADIDGVLWLGRENLALQSIEYDYVRGQGDRIVRRIGDGGGTVNFAYLPSGLWVTVGWHTTSVVATPTGSGGRSRFQSHLIRDGSQVIRALAADSTVLWRAPGYKPLNPSRTISADSARDADNGTAELPLFSVAGLAAHRCSTADNDEVEVVVFVGREDGTPISGAPLRLAWQNKNAIASFDAKTDINGLYVFCKVPNDRDIALTMATAGIRPRNLFLSPKRGMILTRSFFLR
jgi:hypothetical protein